jgi:putative ABC transport system substrate-binding protein
VKRREFITLLGGAAVAWPLSARAQAPRHIPRLCFLTFDPGTLRSNRFDAFFQGLRDLGYANGQNIATDYRYLLTMVTPRSVCVGQHG